MKDIKAIPVEELERARRRLCRRVAAVVVQAMAETDTSIPVIARRIGKTARYVKHCLDFLIAGNDPGDGLAWIADILWAMGAEIEFRVLPRAQGTAARSDETPQAAQPAGQEPGRVSDAPGE